MDYLSLCLIAKDEDAYLQEWLDYHILIGVDRFYIYDNQSQNPIRVLLQHYIEKGWVIVHEIEGQAVQLTAYNHCLQEYGSNSKWMGFIDADEFIVLNKKINLQEFLKEYETYGGLAISSKFFGTGGHQSRPVGGQIINYRFRAPDGVDDNMFVKCIVQPEKVLYPHSPHEFIFKLPFSCINSKFHRVDRQKFPVYYDDIQINHYFSRSEEDVARKVKRLGGAGRKLDQNKFKKLQRGQITEENIFLALSYIFDCSFDEVKTFPQNNELFLTRLYALATKEYPIANGKVVESNIKITQLWAEYYSLCKKINDFKVEKKFLMAKNVIVDILKISPDNPVMYSNYVTFCFMLNNQNEAEFALQKSIEKFGRSYENLRILADYLVIDKKIVLAEKIFLEMLQIGKTADTLVRLMLVLLTQKKYDSVLVCLNELIMKFEYSDIFSDSFSKEVIRNCLNVVSEKVNPEFIKKVTEMVEDEPK